MQKNTTKGYILNLLLIWSQCVFAQNQQEWFVILQKSKEVYVHITDFSKKGCFLLKCVVLYIVDECRKREYYALFEL